MQRIVSLPVRSGSYKFNDGWLSVERSMSLAGHARKGQRRRQRAGACYATS